MEEALEMARSKDTKERMAGVERLHQLLEVARKSLSSSEVSYLVDICLDLLKDNNFRVSQGALQALTSAAVLSGDHLKLHFNAIVPAIVERLGDGKQPVRDAAKRLLLTLMEVSSPTIIVERAGTYAWTHKSWRVREEFARTVTSTVGLFSSTEPTLQRVIMFPILQLLNDSNPGVRESAISCIEEMYSQYGLQFLDELQRHHLPASLIKDINARLERIEPKTHPDTLLGTFASAQMKPVNNSNKRSSPKSKSSTRELSTLGGDIDGTEKSVEPIKVFSEKELLREVEKIASILVPEKDWSVRISAMQRVESLVCGGVADYPCFIGILRQLVNPLSTQLSDRRSTIVKQTCHLLSFLSKELLGDFEGFAEMFIPVLFKLVVITVLVIAESADNCIKTMLRNCKVARSLPKIAECAKNDRSAVLRARCCEYALLILECWADAPEIQRSADLYEDLIKCCVGDAMSEVRSTARTCFRMFTKTWPERSRRLFSSFDPVIQRIINDEEGGMHRRNPSPSLRERCGVQFPFSSHVSTASSHSGYGTSAIVAMDRISSLPSAVSLSSGLLLAQPKSSAKGYERSLESVLHSSKQKVTAIESMLRGLEVSGKKNPSLLSHSSSLDLGVEPPSSRDPPFPLAVTVSNTFVNSFDEESINPAISKGKNDDSGLNLLEIVSQIEASKEVSRYSQQSTSLGEIFAAAPPLQARRLPEKLLERSSAEETINIRDHGRLMMNSSTDKQYFESYYIRDTNFRESQGGYIPNFQRPLLRRHVSGRISAGRRKSFDDNQFPAGGISSYMCEPMSLNDALTDGLGSSSDWSARVSAFNCIQTLLQQGQKGIQDVSQNFERVMKMLFLHLDDPHHKVAQAALSTLSDIIPSCRKQFEGYMERILPHVFSRLVDPKEHVRQHCSTTLEILSKTYSTDSLLPTLLRSLDEQRSPKAKLAVIEFANSCFSANPLNSEGLGNSGIMKLWLAKLAPLVHDKNPKLKEASVSCIISVYSHVDSSAVLNFIVCLSVDEQNSLRRALKQYTPKIEVDLMNILQNKKERPRPKMAYDQTDVVGVSSEDGHTGMVKRTQYTGRYSSGSADGGDGGRKWSSVYETKAVLGSGVHDVNDGREPFSKSPETTIKDGDWNYTGGTDDGIAGWANRIENVQTSVNFDNHVPGSGLNGSILPNSVGDIDADSDSTLMLHKEISPKAGFDHFTHSSMNIISSTDIGLSIPQILHVICNGGDENAVVGKRNALQQLVKISIENDHLIWNKFFNQILTVVLEVLDDMDSSLRELALSLINEMLINQKESMDESVEIVTEKLLHVTKDMIPKVTSESERCLGIVLSQHDPFRCLSVVSPLLITDDEKTLVICINSLTKLVARITEQQLMAQLPTFLPALFDAFGNPSADVRKTVVFCLVDMYIILGKDFLPYLEGLNPTQLRLVTIYASRISLARKGT